MTARSPDPNRSATYGIADWPYGRSEGLLARPGSLPAGRPWPRLRVLTIASGDEPRLADGVASVARQDYPECRHDVVPAGSAPSAAILADEAVDYVLVLPAGDLLAPGALAALALEAALSGAGAVAGLRVLFDGAVTSLDVPSLSGEDTSEIPFTGGEVLWRRDALAALPGLDLSDAGWAAHAWAAVGRTARGLARIGRPVLLQFDRLGERETDSTLSTDAFQPAPLPPPYAGGGKALRLSQDSSQSPTLSIASLTGTGHAGGAGIAHRRLGEALRLAGHRVVDVVLADESPPVAAEWTDAFPVAEAAIGAGGHDLVLAGNLHGATRSLAIAGRLAADRPVALVLHDLFPLTGRCAHPRGCLRIETVGCDAACPTPDEYPQLARRRIAGTHAAKRAVLSLRDGPILLANSAWTAARAAALAPPGTVVAPLALAFPTNVFRPGDRTALRRALGLPADDLLILVSAVVLDGPDKNVGDLAEALRRVAGPGIGFVAIGRLDHPARLALPNLFAPGLVADEAQLAVWYGACDLHVTASRLETLGQTPIEAGLCGTPTLAYRTAGLTTSVIDGVSGRLVPVEPGALGDALVELVADRADLARLGAFARIALESRFSPAACAMSLDRVFRERGMVPSHGHRVRFAPEMLGQFPFAAMPAVAATGLVAAQSGPFVRGLRRAKQRLLGRRLPPWARRGLYWAARLRSLRGGRR
ncbi:D-inositol-3-phosphate glycosyltransferase [Methylobacterium cerastii]|uniref:D-inositol-3-phosphate glycosyltransferase n=1 Tax=Methylobacterium cerastii TaxID=932741 RepID=A0ABQ4QEC4_9HYPH|nr:glycosyltransferase [Methylobacterium cerastii]GJD43576.1 D-inositol-3-phosphate glycosyltransferase [Methylobacterium cerastii]